MTSLNKSIARVVRTTLRISGVLQNEFAESIGESNSNVSRWLAGGSFSVDKLDAMARGLGLEVDELVRLGVLADDLNDAELIALLAKITERIPPRVPHLRPVVENNNGA